MKSTRQKLAYRNLLRNFGGPVLISPKGNLNLMQLTPFGGEKICRVEMRDMAAMRRSRTVDLNILVTVQHCLEEQDEFA
jgi:hypothetical protein